MLSLYRKTPVSKSNSYEHVNTSCLSQEELKRKHEQAVTDRESAKMHNGAPSTIYSAPLNTVQSPAQINVQVPAAQVPAAQVPAGQVPAGQSSEQENPVPQPDVVMSTHVNPTSYVSSK